MKNSYTFKLQTLKLGGGNDTMDGGTTGGDGGGSDGSNGGDG